MSLIRGRGIIDVVGIAVPTNVGAPHARRACPPRPGISGHVGGLSDMGVGSWPARAVRAHALPLVRLRLQPLRRGVFLGSCAVVFACGGAASDRYSHRRGLRVFWRSVDAVAGRAYGTVGIDPGNFVARAFACRGCNRPRIGCALLQIHKCARDERGGTRPPCGRGRSDWCLGSIVDDQACFFPRAGVPVGDHCDFAGRVGDRRIPSQVRQRPSARRPRDARLA